MTMRTSGQMRHESTGRPRRHESTLPESLPGGDVSLTQPRLSAPSPEEDPEMLILSKARNVSPFMESSATDEGEDQPQLSGVVTNQHLPPEFIARTQRHSNCRPPGLLSLQRPSEKSTESENLMSLPSTSPSLSTPGGFAETGMSSCDKALSPSSMVISAVSGLELSPGTNAMLVSEFARCRSSPQRERHLHPVDEILKSQEVTWASKMKFLSGRQPDNGNALSLSRSLQAVPCSAPELGGRSSNHQHSFHAGSPGPRQLAPQGSRMQTGIQDSLSASGCSGLNAGATGAKHSSGRRDAMRPRKELPQGYPGWANIFEQAKQPSEQEDKSPSCWLFLQGKKTQARKHKTKG